MSTKITIAAVGDILMWRRQIAAARLAGKDSYSFYSMFAKTAPILRRADLAIGNLETTLSGREKTYQIGSARQGFPRFNCPDELAPALKKAGFRVLTTANNHCLDRGVKGLKRTLNVLDRYKIGHTGTFRTQREAKRLPIWNVKGVRIGLLAYTYGTNRQRVPADTPWLVNRIRLAQILKDIDALRPKVDLLIVALHFGVEFRHTPTARQKRLVNTLLNRGADVILGAHPHVLQPVVVKKVVLPDGTIRRKVAAFSLGNFISDKMLRFSHSLCGTILRITVEKDQNGKTSITRVSAIPTWTQIQKTDGKLRFRVLPMKQAMRNPDSSISPAELKQMRSHWKKVRQLLRAIRLS